MHTLSGVPKLVSALTVPQAGEKIYYSPEGHCNGNHCSPQASYQAQELCQAKNDALGVDDVAVLGVAVLFVGSPVHRAVVVGEVEDLPIELLRVWGGWIEKRSLINRIYSLQPRNKLSADVKRLGGSYCCSARQFDVDAHYLQRTSTSETWRVAQTAGSILQFSTA